MLDLVRHITIPAALISAACLLLGGCYTSTESRQPRTERPAALPDDAWPALDAAAVEPVRVATPRVVPAFKLAPGSTLEQLSNEDRVRLETPECMVDWNQICGREPGLGLLRIYQHPETAAPSDPDLARLQRQLDEMISGRFEFNASFLTSNHVTSARWHEYQQENGFTGFGFAGVAATGSAGPLLATRLDVSLGIESGIRIELPTVKPTTRPRGLILYFCTLFPNEYEHAAVERLREEGWAVVCFDTSITPRLPRDPAAMSRLPELNARKAELEGLNAEFFRVATPGTETARPYTPEETAAMRERTAEYTALLVRISDIRRGWFTLESADQVESVAAQAAEAVDRTIAENAYAAEAALQYLALEHPDIPQSPLVVVGMSAGSLAAPAVAARLSDRVNAVVLVAGGADLFDISQRSTLKSASISFRIDEQNPAPKHLMPALHEAYLRKTRLDPYAVAPALARTPVLTILAVNDTIVPASSGEVMWQRLGRPDRTTYRLGYAEPHYELFYFLSRHSGEIAHWIDTKTRNPAARVWSE